MKYSRHFKLIGISFTQGSHFYICAHELKLAEPNHISDVKSQSVRSKTAHLCRLHVNGMMMMIYIKNRKKDESNALFR